MNVISLPSLPSTVGSSANFTNQTHVVPVLQTGEPTNLTVTRRLTVRSLNFDRSARTHWHSHPLGQLLIVTHGSGRIQQRGQPVRRLTPGDIVWTPPAVEHWHGADKVGTMTHVAVVWGLDGKIVDWKEPVGDAEYNAEPELASGERLE